MKELVEKVGQEGYIVTQEGLKVAVKVLDVKSVYGSVRYLVTPLSGSGEAWKQDVQF